MRTPILDAIGNTPLVELVRVVPPGSARVVAKLESANPTGSMKDRVARALVEGGVRDGLSGGPTGSHGIEGIGIGFSPPLSWRAEVDEILTVTTADAKAMARRLAREEGIFAGTSTGANVVAALRVGARLGAAATVATVVVDSGLRYVSTDVFRT